MPTRLIEFKEVGKFKKYPGGFCRVYCLKSLKKPSICLQGMTPSAPSEIDPASMRSFLNRSPKVSIAVIFEARSKITSPEG